MFVVAGDFHTPYCSVTAKALFFDFLKAHRPDGVVLNGDIIDFYAISSFDRDPSRINTLQRDIDKAVRLMEKIYKYTNKVFFIKGNHEKRLKKFLLVKAPELLCLRELQLQKLLKFEELGIEYHEYDVKIGKFVITHGDVIRKHSSYSAKAMYEKIGTSLIMNHTHRGGSFYKTMMGKNYKAYENFCLCTLNPDYMNRPNWQTGFCVLERDYVQQVFIDKQRMKYGKEVYYAKGRRS